MPILEFYLLSLLFPLELFPHTLLKSSTCSEYLVFFFFLFFWHLLFTREHTVLLCSAFSRVLTCFPLPSIRFVGEIQLLSECSNFQILFAKLSTMPMYLAPKERSYNFQRSHPCFGALCFFPVFFFTTV